MNTSMSNANSAKLKELSAPTFVIRSQSNVNQNLGATHYFDHGLMALAMNNERIVLAGKKWMPLTDANQ
ncbi:hypothetical protein IXO621_05835 [Xanthomonas oryzae pv. oryzae]|nr:hypothetical protein IXO621_05835 [Xanthomonas oryzae pv. oryzae]OLK43434.1 hypothetical protein IXO620_15505 [Xanthomonas oryzae pv. oryzae]PUE97106.1 hypothetical protein C7T79_06200 [Xanthomonas oryzae pv. oryzicola]